MATTAALFDMRVSDGADGADVAEPSGEAAPAAQAPMEQGFTVEQILAQARAQGQRRSEEEQLRRDETAEQSEMDETSTRSVATDQRLTVRLVTQWHKLRGNRRCPLVSEFLSSIPPELLPDCFNFVSGKSLDEGRISLGNNVARISGITKSSLLLAEVPGNTLLGAAIRSLEDTLKGNPIPDSGEFEDGKGQSYLYRAILLPLEDDEGEIIQVIGGARCKARATAEPAVPKILVIDDDPQITKALMIQLGALGLEVVRSPNAKVGVPLAKTECPDLIIIDQNMPEMSSEYLLVKLKGEEETKDIPIIVIMGQRVDGHEDLSLKREMLGRRGAVAYLTKPVDFNALLDVLNRHIRMPRAIE